MSMAGIANIAYAAYRAQYLRSCDLVHGYLEPTRAVVFGGADPSVDFTFNSFAPFFYAVLAPLALLPNAVASVAWSVLSIAFLLGALVWLRAMPSRTSDPMPVLWPVVWATPLVSDNLNLGQSNLLALFFVCGALYALSVRAEGRAGLLLSVAIAWKLTPALFLVLLVVQRRFRALLGVALGLVLCFAVVPSVALGPARAAQLTMGWAKLVLAPVVSGEKGRTSNINWYHTNQSMEAVLQRSLTRYGQEHYQGLHAYTDPAFLNEAQTHRVATIMRLVLIAALAFAAFRSSTENLQLVGALFVLGALFLSPASWFSHYVAAIVAYAVAWHERGRCVGQSHRRLTLGLTAAVVLTWASLGSYARSHSLVFAGHLALFVALYRHLMMKTERA